MNDEEKELINNIERALNLSEVKGDLVTIIYNYIVKATINLINKLQKELDKSNKRIDMCIELLNLEDCLKFDTKQEKLDCIDRLVEIDKASYLEQIFPKNKLQKELDKKDKVLKETFKYIDEHTYRDMEECEFGEANNFICCKDCEKCIKEYFYKKVEEEND